MKRIVIIITFFLSMVGMLGEASAHGYWGGHHGYYGHGYSGHGYYGHSYYGRGYYYPRSYYRPYYAPVVLGPSYYPPYYYDPYYAPYYGTSVVYSSPGFGIRIGGY